jgi:hypothetical protein
LALGNGLPANGVTATLDRADNVTILRNGLQARSGTAILKINALRDDVLRIRVGPGRQSSRGCKLGCSTECTGCRRACRGGARRKRLGLSNARPRRSPGAVIQCVWSIRDLLVLDLKRRGLLESTIVVWGGEFGCTPINEARNQSKFLGRDHHPRAFTMWIAGGGLKPGLTFGKTDDLGYNITEDRRRGGDGHHEDHWSSNPQRLRTLQHHRPH